MTWNGSVTTVVKGPCVVCGKPVERSVSVNQARHTKRLTCGGWRCKQALRGIRKVAE